VPFLVAPGPQKAIGLLEPIMSYVSEWLRLPVVLKRVMAPIGLQARDWSSDQ
jgi:hypothetical protein